MGEKMGTGTLERAQLRRLERAFESDSQAISVYLDLIAAGLQTGVSIPSVLVAVGTAAGNRELIEGGERLLTGYTWEDSWGNLSPELRSVIDTIEPAWTRGVAPVQLLEYRQQQLTDQWRRTLRQQAAKLGAHLVLPIGLCYLPAFILCAIVPLVIGLGAGLLFG